MKYVLMTLSLMGGLVVSAQKKPVVKVTPVNAALPANGGYFKLIGKSQKDSASFAMGQLIANNIFNEYFKQLSQNVGALNRDLFKKGFQEYLRTEKLNQDQNVLNNTVERYRTIEQKKKDVVKQKELQPLIKKGKDYLDSVAKTPGAVKLPSGLIYKIKKDTTGPKPKATDQVSVYYNGTLMDGTKFDGNFGSGNPISFALNGVIRGWTEGVQYMSKGAVYTFYIPYDLAYGLEGRPPQIPQAAPLIFDIELVDIIKGDSEGEVPPPSGK